MSDRKNTKVAKRRVRSKGLSQSSPSTLDGGESMASPRGRSHCEPARERRPRRAVIPREVREAVLARLEPEQRRYIDSGAASGFAFEWKGDYLYVGSRDSGFRGGQRHLSPLCRLRFTGDIERWGFEIYKHSDNWYDEDNDFPSGGGPPEYCFSVAADFYLWEYDAFEAGKSCGTVLEPTISGGFEGQAALLPACTVAEVPRPERPMAAEAAAQGALITDFDAFLSFVAGRSFDLGGRTMGFRQETLREVNALLQQPHELTQRPVQDHVPRVQVCFAVMQALGMLAVDQRRHRAAPTGAVEEFQRLPGSERWWLVLEALWQRVSWFGLRLDAHGCTERQQAGRVWLGEELARRTKPLGFDSYLTWSAEVLEVFLFPAWRDAGLLELSYAKPAKSDRWLANRSTHLREVQITDLGRWAFAALAAASPRYTEEEMPLPDDRDGTWQGQEFLHQLDCVAPCL